ncbi:hypothetical protein Aduo_001343 [Ancylostoma duodenale]
MSVFMFLFVGTQVSKRLRRRTKQVPIGVTAPPACRRHRTVGTVERMLLRLSNTANHIPLIPGCCLFLASMSSLLNTYSFIVVVAYYIGIGRRKTSSAADVQQEHERKDAELRMKYESTRTEVELAAHDA